MKIKHIIATLLAFALIPVGCAPEEPKETKLIEQTAAPKPVLTSTLPSEAAATPLEEKPEAPVAKEPEAIDAPAKTDETMPKTFEPELRHAGGLSLTRLVTTSSVESREPTAVGSSFGPIDERIYAFIEVRNESESDASLMVHFIGPNQKVSGGIELEVPASVPRWRTWAYTRHAKDPGLWRVEIRDAQGTLIGALPFEIEEAH
jgi:hypothetical protein